MNRIRCCSLALAVVLAGGASAVRSAKEMTPAERTELETLRRQLADPERTGKTKHEAALLLLTRTHPQAVQAVCDFLADQANSPAQVAIAVAIAESGRTREEFIKPLLGMLTGAEPSVRVPAANALAAYKDHGVLDEFVKLVTDRKTDRSARLAVIAAMQRILDKRSVDALVGLLGDGDEDVRNAACDSLAKLTNIRAFGRDRRRWRSWWSQNKDKPRSEWLTDLANNLARTNLELERQNAELCRRLAAAMNDLYAATPPTGRDALLTAMLKDPLGEVRLAGVRLTHQRIGNSQPLPQPLQVQLRAMLGDSAAPVRREVALLLPRIGDDQAVELLGERLKAESSSEVREAIYQGLGLLRDVRVWDQLVAGIAKEEQSVAAAAAAALARVAEKKGIDDARRTAADAAVRKRYQAAGKANSAGLREALLTAMGELNGAQPVKLIHAALKDPAATVRLSAVKALQRLGRPDSAAAVAPLTGDADRGVRMAAIAAIGGLGATDHLQTVLTRTDGRVEPDAAVRQQAWTVVMGLLEKADVATLTLLADQLGGREGAREYLIQLLRLWVAKIPAAVAEDRVKVRLHLGEVLLSAGRPAEATRELAAAHAVMAKASSPDAPRVWAKWVEALLAADDASAVARIAENADAAQFAAAVEALTKRVEALQGDKDWDRLVRLASGAQDRLGGRLDDPRRQWLAKSLTEAQVQRSKADGQRVAALAARLSATDQAARTAAEKELAAMNHRAVPHLLGELRRALTAEPPDPKTEQAIVKLLGKLAPKLTGYDPAAPQDQRVAVVDRWLKELGS